MMVAKLIRHRHKYHHYVNDDLKAVEEDVHFKVVFSHPAEMDMFQAWCKKNKGEYKYNKDASKQEGKLPKLKEFVGDDICWCDIITYYLLNNGYSFYSTIHPYKGEVYIKN